MNNRGQTAFEALFVFVVVISAAVALLSLYYSINDDTVALMTARAETNNQIAMQKTNAEILRLDLQKNGTDANITIELSEKINLDKTAISKSIAANTSFKNILVKVQ